MSLVLLESKDAVQAAIATMHPAASEAAQLLAHRIFENPGLFQDEEALKQEWAAACAISLDRAGYDTDSNPEVLYAFLEHHGEGVANVAISIVHVTIKDQKRRQTWGWVGKAACVGLGAAFGILVG